MDLYWKPMPYYWIRKDGVLKSFKRNEVSTAIAALKIYILIVLTSNKDTDGMYSSSITYDQITKTAAISRKLVSAGFKKLFEMNLIDFCGVRKKKYFLIGVTYLRMEDIRLCPQRTRFSSAQGYWAKTPNVGLIDEMGRITAFEAMTNRSHLELNSLKLFIYLLSIKSKGTVVISVSPSKIKSNIGISYPDIFAAIGFMQSIGMIYRANLGTNTISYHEPSVSIHFLLCGWESLEWKPYYVSDSEWKEKFLSDAFPDLEIPRRSK